MTKQEAEQAVSPELLEAQARLLSMRAQQRRVPARLEFPEAARAISYSREYQPRILRPEIDRSDDSTFRGLPAHLGWGSQRLAEQLRQSQCNQRRHAEAASGPKPGWLEDIRGNQPPAPVRKSTVPLTIDGSSKWNSNAGTRPALSATEFESGTIKLYPDIGLGILRSKLAAPGRVWLLLRWIDRAGSGRIKVEQARHLLCEQDSATKVCGWRQLRSLIARGDGIFWTQQGGSLWLRSIPKIARALNIEKLCGHPVDLPVRILVGSIGKIRAHLYASFHSGRKRANPISRAALTKISQVSPRSQRNYEKRAVVRKHKNYAIGSQLTDDNIKNQGWRHGSACFKWHDHKGIFSAQKCTRLAWQLPNSYRGPHARRPRGRQRQFNRELAVLSNKGMTGNDQNTGELQPKRYFDAAADAIKSVEQGIDGVYWRGEHSEHWYFLDSSGLL